jgi:predicted DNA-binding transcriptional regulator AlpA
MRLLSIGAVATTLGVSVFSIRKSIANGAFPEPVQIGASKRWSISQIRDFSLGKWRPDDAFTDLTRQLALESASTDED